MKYASISAIAALMMCPAVAMAASPQLKGDYAVTGFASCQHSGLQFTTDGVVYRPTPLLVSPGNPNGVFFSTFSTQGVRSFDATATAQ